MKITSNILFKYIMVTMICGFLAAPVVAQNSFIVSMTDKDVEWLPAPEFFPGCSFTVLHGDLAKPNLDFFFKIEPKTDVVMHTHASPERMILVSGELEVQYEGEEPGVMKEGNYAYGPAKKPHRAKCLSTKPCVLFVAMIDPFTAAPVARKKP